ncbi:MAG: hypothetical protein ACTSSP_05690 [Candidatus Asgardarchaeia archaeon]
MKKIDYKFFVPNGKNNYIKFCTDPAFEIHIDKVASVTIHMIDDKVVYWLYFRIAMDDMKRKLLLKRDSEHRAILLIGNNSYEIMGNAKVIELSNNNWEQKIEIKLLYTVVCACGGAIGLRKEMKDDTERFEIIDYENAE